MNPLVKNQTPADFFLVGASKSGTTSLFQVLRTHPQLFFPANKEPHYFSWARDPDSESALFYENSTAGKIKSEASYRSLFKAARNGQRRGDASTSYLSHPHAAERISQCCPDARIIILLRDPVERAYSAFQHYRRELREPMSTLGTALKNDSTASAQFRKQYYLDHGLYEEQIQRYYRLFPSNQIRVYQYGALIQSHIEVLNNIYQFLNVTTPLTQEPLPQLNRSGTTRHLWLRSLIKMQTPLHGALRITLSPKTRSRIRELLEHINTTPPPPEDRDCTAELEAFYRDDTKKLENLLGEKMLRWGTRKAS